MAYKAVSSCLNHQGLRFRNFLLSQDVQQENTVLSALPLEDMATFSFLADVELGEGNTGQRMKESGDVTQETVSAKRYAAL